MVRLRFDSGWSWFVSGWSWFDWGSIVVDHGSLVVDRGLIVVQCGSSFCHVHHRSRTLARAKFRLYHILLNLYSYTWGLMSDICNMPAFVFLSSKHSCQFLCHTSPTFYWDNVIPGVYKVSTCLRCIPVKFWGEVKRKVEWSASENGYATNGNTTYWHDEERRQILWADLGRNTGADLPNGT